MGKSVVAGVFGLAAIPAGYLMEPLFPYGDWRWGLLLGLCLVPGAIMYRRAIWRFLRALFGNASATPALAQGIAGHAEEAEESAANPGNGRRMVRRIMAASTVNEVDDLYDDFKIAPRRTKEGEVFAAFALKKARLLGNPKRRKLVAEPLGER